MARGYKTGGRTKGTPNKTTASVKAALEEAFDRLGGVEVLTEWAAENPRDFYILWARMLPQDLKASIEQHVTLEDLICGMGE